MQRASDGDLDGLWIVNHGLPTTAHGLPTATHGLPMATHCSPTTPTLTPTHESEEEGSSGAEEFWLFFQVEEMCLPLHSVEMTFFSFVHALLLLFFSMQPDEIYRIGRSNIGGWSRYFGYFILPSLQCQWIKLSLFLYFSLCDGFGMSFFTKFDPLFNE
ncbi:uncharacterized protein LOC127148850 isoform X2 [Cucumis melo]|uniref:Uncharacterized protein LOC127148850 isoform X2 n=1 Tax=Cucumis melo TaxID=3656 RepID=A0ABM3KN29_CUCME|nr:uncharacterized protein LOC127148850 isoform X2 [Cucumis melo]